MIFNSKQNVPDFANAEGNRYAPPPPAFSKGYPERRLTTLAFLLALLERASNHIAMMAFIWATVIILGGFVTALGVEEFWLVSGIVLIESLRIYLRGQETKLRMYARLNDANMVPTKGFIPDIKHLVMRVIYSRFTSALLYLLQISSAMASSVLSLLELCNHDFSVDSKTIKANGNALKVFYLLVMVESILFLVEKAYYQWEIRYNDIIEKVWEDYRLPCRCRGAFSMFFDDAYSACVNRSILDGLEMDISTFAMDYLHSKEYYKKHIGAQLLVCLTDNHFMQTLTLDRIETNLPLMDKLVQLLDSTIFFEEVAEILLKVLERKVQNTWKMARIDGSIEHISSLLYYVETADVKPYLFGLKMLRVLAEGVEIVEKILNMKTLLAKVVCFTLIEASVLQAEDENSKLKISVVTSALELLSVLATTKVETGDRLRQDLPEFTITNIELILLYSYKHPRLEKLGKEILTKLGKY